MELRLNWSPTSSPIERQDIDWLTYMWECSSDYNVIINLENLPTYLINTVIYPCAPQRFLYYCEMCHLLNFKYDKEKKAYSIALEKDFVSILNGLIDECNRKSYITEDPIQYIREKGDVIVNNQINNSGTFYSSVSNQIGDKNSSTQSLTSQKKDGIKFDFKGLVYALLKKIPFLKDFISKD